MTVWLVWVCIKWWPEHWFLRLTVGIQAVHGTQCEPLEWECGGFDAHAGQDSWPCNYQRKRNETKTPAWNWKLKIKSFNDRASKILYSSAQGSNKEVCFYYV